MPKSKTKSAAKKRFKVTATGKIMYKHAFKNHILTKKSHKRKKHLGSPAQVDTTNAAAVREMLCI
jgi:large subunit ribosomal protein L35